MQPSQCVQTSVFSAKIRITGVGALPFVEGEGGDSLYLRNHVLVAEIFCHLKGGDPHPLRLQQMPDPAAEEAILIVPAFFRRPRHLCLFGITKKPSAADAPQASSGRLSYEEQKELNKRLKKLERRVADCEAEIGQTEAAISILEAKMATPEGASDMSLYEQHQKLKEQLDRAMEEWDAASTELEAAKK